MKASNIWTTIGVGFFLVCLFVAFACMGVETPEHPDFSTFRFVGEHGFFPRFIAFIWLNFLIWGGVALSNNLFKNTNFKLGWIIWTLIILSFVCYGLSGCN